MFRKIVLLLCAASVLVTTQGAVCAATLNINIPGPRTLYLPNVQLNSPLHIRVPARIDRDMAAGVECRRFAALGRRAVGQRRPECRRD